MNKKIYKFLAGLLFFLILLLCIYKLHIEYFRVNVILYASILDVFLALIFTGILMYSTSLFSPLQKFEKFLSLICFVFIGYSVAISVPTIIDRSLSFYILEKLVQRGGGIYEDQLNNVIIDEFMDEYKVTNARITEQLETGNIKINDGCISLTKRGIAVATFSNYFRKNWLPKMRLLRESYTDELVNPLSNIVEQKQYSCRIK